MSIANTELPDDFVEKVLQNTHPGKHTLRDAVDNAIPEVLHRPLMPEEQWASIDQTETNASTDKLAKAVLRHVIGKQ